MIKKQLKKKRATKKEIKELRDIVIDIQKNPVAMMQIRKLIGQTV